MSCEKHISCGLSCEGEADLRAQLAARDKYIGKLREALKVIRDAKIMGSKWAAKALNIPHPNKNKGA